MKTRSIIPAAICGVALAFMLGGCSSAHQAITGPDKCVTCHNSSYYADPSAGYSTAGAKYSATGALSVTVNGDNRFYVCTPTGSFAGSDAAPIPIISQTITVTEGEPYALTLDAGTYILVAQNNGKVSSQMIIVDAGTTESTTDAVTLSI